ncbi:hypothetical protein B0H14DRAFT_2609566 [Mycena olivaceomarginata]|nr:hypothetical protein B0H14DRAFT_2609566 [Mycena olivaceomarginata]
MFSHMKRMYASVNIRQKEDCRTHPQCRVQVLRSLPLQDTNTIIDFVGGTGGSGGSGGQEGGDGGLGEGPTFQATSMHIVIQNQSVEDHEIIQWALPLNFFPVSRGHIESAPTRNW